MVRPFPHLTHLGYRGGMSTQTHNNRPETPMLTGTIPNWTIQDRLRKARDHAGLSQGELADRVGITRTMAANVENGRTEPRPIVIRMWAMCTGVDAGWLETGESPHPVDPDGGSELPRLDSNQQPSDMSSPQVARAAMVHYLRPAQRERKAA